MHIKVISPKDINHYKFNIFFIYPYISLINYRLLKNWRRPSSGKISQKVNGNSEIL